MAEIAANGDFTPTTPTFNVHRSEHMSYPQRDIDTPPMTPRNLLVRETLGQHFIPDDDASSNASNMSAPSTTASDAFPSLTRGQSEFSFGVSVHTDIADEVMGNGYLLEEHEGILILPTRYQPDADILCPFQVLDCMEMFADILSFKTHVFSHFRGFPLPPKAACFLCDNVYTQTPEDDQALAWNNMLSHLVRHHFRQGERLATLRPNFDLMRWMFARRLISSSQFKRLQLMPIPVLLPNPRGGLPGVENLPPAPMAPSAPPPMFLSVRRSTPLHLSMPATPTVGFDNEAFTITAGRHAERRRLNATSRGLNRARSYM